MCENFVWHTNGVVELCGWFHRCPECERRYAILRAHLAASRNRSANINTGTLVDIRI